jgi:ferredoxin
MTRSRSSRTGTRAFFEEADKLPDFDFFDRLHAYVYARWPYLYIGIGTRRHPLARVVAPLVMGLVKLFPWEPAGDDGTFADSYHGKVVPLEAARQLVTVQQDIDLGDLEQIVPYSRARAIVLRNPDHIVVLECPCRVTSAEPCLPLDVCLVIGEPFASFVLEHHPRRSRRITPQEAETILREEHERGHVSHAFFKDAMLGRFYAICNCCSCCCGAMSAWQNGTPMLASSGYEVHVEGERCKGCGLCVDACQFKALSLNGRTVLADAVACMGCGVCVDKCAREALSLLRAPGRGEPLEIQKLMAEVTDATAPQRG